jgi:hypothetical protein
MKDTFHVIVGFVFVILVYVMCIGWGILWWNILFPGISEGNIAALLCFVPAILSWCAWPFLKFTSFLIDL